MWHGHRTLRFSPSNSPSTLCSFLSIYILLWRLLVLGRPVTAIYVTLQFSSTSRCPFSAHVMLFVRGDRYPAKPGRVDDKPLICSGRKEWQQVLPHACSYCVYSFGQVSLQTYSLSPELRTPAAFIVVFNTVVWARSCAVNHWQAENDYILSQDPICAPEKRTTVKIWNGLVRAGEVARVTRGRIESLASLCRNLLIPSTAGLAIPRARLVNT